MFDFVRHFGAHLKYKHMQLILIGDVSVAENVRQMLQEMYY